MSDMLPTQTLLSRLAGAQLSELGPGLSGSGRLDAVRDPDTGADVPALFSSAGPSEDGPVLIDPRLSMSLSPGGPGVKSFANPAPSSGLRAIDLFTSLILDGSHITRPGRLVSMFFPATAPTIEGGHEIVDGLQFWRPVFDTSGIARHETRLAEYSPFNIIDQGVTWVADTVESYGLASVLTRKEARIAHPSIDWGARKRRLPARGLRIAQDHQAFDLLSDATPGNTFGAVKTIGAGAEWDDATPGDAYADLRLAIETVADAAGVDEDQVELAMTPKALEAALGNSTVQTHITGQSVLVDRGGTIDGRYEILRAVLGVKAIHKYSFVGVDPTTGVWGKLTDDEVIAFVNVVEGSEEYDTTDGAQRWSANFSVAGFLALEDIPMPWIRTTAFPVIGEYALRVLDPDLAYLILNTSVK